MVEDCKKCGGEGIVKDENGSHTCWDCLESGNLDAHSDKLPETSLRELFDK